jgi:phage terminase small subunit
MQNDTSIKNKQHIILLIRGNNMARPRKPTAVLELNGSFKKDPSRKRDKEPIIDKKVGDPPSYFELEQIEMWNEIKASIVQGVAILSDKFSLEMLCNALVEYRRNPFDFTAADKAQLRSMLNGFGMSPSSRAQIEIPQPKVDNPWDKFD